MKTAAFSLRDIFGATESGNVIDRGRSRALNWIHRPSRHSAATMTRTAASRRLDIRGANTLRNARDYGRNRVLRMR